MTDQFDQKLQSLNAKLQNMERPCSLVERQSRSKDEFLRIRRKISQKLQAIERELKYIDQRVQKYQSKIQTTKLTVNNFSGSKHSHLKQIIENWVENFHQKIKSAKQNLRSYEIATDVKINEIQKDNEALVTKIQDKISKNLNKIHNSMENLSKICQQERDLIKKQFQVNKNNIQRLIAEKDRNQSEMEKRINQKVFEIEAKIEAQIKLLTQKWIKKDEKTRKIFELLVEDEL